MGVTSVRLRSEIETPLEKLAIKLDRSKNYLINQAVAEFIERSNLEEQRWNETLEAIESVKSGHLIDEDRVNNWLDSWGTDNEVSPPKL
jgi:predicted transcriptional regulator